MLNTAEPWDTDEAGNEFLGCEPYKLAVFHADPAWHYYIIEYTDPDEDPEQVTLSEPFATQHDAKIEGLLFLLSLTA